MILTAGLAVGLALIHFFAGRMVSAQPIPEKQWVSLAGGISVAFVFVHVLPALNDYQEQIAASEWFLLEFLEYHTYLVALIGLAAFYGLEHRIKNSVREKNPEAQRRADLKDFWLHVGAFALYNAVIGYLLADLPDESRSQLFFFVAMGVHLLVIDSSLRDHHEKMYDNRGRWVLGAAVLTGWGAGTILQLNEPALAILYAFVAGGIVLNVLKEELPAERESRFWAFAVGAAGYTALLLFL